MFLFSGYCTFFAYVLFCKEIDIAKKIKNTHSQNFD